MQRFKAILLQNCFVRDDPDLLLFQPFFSMGF